MTLSDPQVTQLLTAAYPSVYPSQDLLESLLADLQNASLDLTPHRRLPPLSRPKEIAKKAAHGSQQAEFARQAV